MGLYLIYSEPTPCEPDHELYCLNSHRRFCTIPREIYWYFCFGCISPLYSYRNAFLHKLTMIKSRDYVGGLKQIYSFGIVGKSFQTINSKPVPSHGMEVTLLMR